MPWKAAVLRTAMLLFKILLLYYLHPFATLIKYILRNIQSPPVRFLFNYILTRINVVCFFFSYFNTTQPVNYFVKGVKESGHLAEIISLAGNEVRECLGCNACRYGKPCIQKDAFNDMIPKIKAADCLVFASPLKTPVPRWEDMKNIQSKTVHCS